MFIGRCGCLRCFEPSFCLCKFQFLVERPGAGLAAAAVNAAALIQELARMDTLTTRGMVKSATPPTCSLCEPSAGVFEPLRAREAFSVG